MRAIVCAGASLVAACATIAGLEEPTEPAPVGPDSDLAETPLPSEASTPSPGSPADAAAADVQPETAPPPPPCTLKPNDQSCTQGPECCSGHCREDRRCVAECEGLGGNCPFPVPGNEDCCMGLWCGPTLKCEACVPPGQPAKNHGGGNPTSRSCCSRDMDDGNICK
jgi:hypothetical protein